MYKKYVKRGLDILISLFLLILCSPVLLIVSICIKLDTPGKVFFLQQRIGKDGKSFWIIKFRTMIENAEKIGDGIFIFDDHDNRVTRVGRILRGCSADELPNLINVLKGDMSLVGPRPPVLYHPYDGYEKYSNLTWL